MALLWTRSSSQLGAASKSETSSTWHTVYSLWLSSAQGPHHSLGLPQSQRHLTRGIQTTLWLSSGQGPHHSWGLPQSQRHLAHGIQLLSVALLWTRSSSQLGAASKSETSSMWQATTLWLSSAQGPWLYSSEVWTYCIVVLRQGYSIALLRPQRIVVLLQRQPSNTEGKLLFTEPGPWFYSVGQATTCDASLDKIQILHLCTHHILVLPQGQLSSTGAKQLLSGSFGRYLISLLRTRSISVLPQGLSRLVYGASNSSMWPSSTHSPWFNWLIASWFPPKLELSSTGGKQLITESLLARSLISQLWRWCLLSLPEGQRCLLLGASVYSLWLLCTRSLIMQLRTHCILVLFLGLSCLVQGASNYSQSLLCKVLDITTQDSVLI